MGELSHKPLCSYKVFGVYMCIVISAYALLKKNTIHAITIGMQLEGNELLLISS